MREIGVRRLKQTLSETLRAVGRGELVRVTLRGRPMADIVPAGAPAGDDRLRRLIVEGRVAPPARTRPAQRTTTGPTVAPGVRSWFSPSVTSTLILYLDSSALVRRYVNEPGSDLVRAAMQSAEGWYICRIGYLETVRAVNSPTGQRATRPVSEEWPSFAWWS